MSRLSSGCLSSGSLSSGRRKAWAAILIGCLAATSCAVSGLVTAEEASRAVQFDQETDDALLGTGAQPTIAPVGSSAKSRRIYLVDQDDRVLVALDRAIAEPVNTDRVLRALFETRPSSEELHMGLVNIIPRDVTLRDLHTSGDLIVVNLDRWPLTSQDSMLALAQIVFTATQDAPKATIKITVEGKPLPLLSEDGRERDVVGRIDFPNLDKSARPSPT